MPVVPNETSTGISTWDAQNNLGAAAAYRPGLPDVNNAELQNRGKTPPNAPTFPTANQLNGTMLLVLALGKVVANAKLSIKYTGGNPVIDYGTAAAGVSPGSVNPVTAAGVLNVTRTPGGAGAGDVFIWWANGVFPAPASRPSAALNGATPGMAPAADWYTDSGSGHTGVRIVTKDAANTAADLPFTVEVM